MFRSATAYTPLDTLQQVKDSLADFQNQPVSIAVRVSDVPCDSNRDGRIDQQDKPCRYGHRIVPYRVDTVNGESRIYVYENNHPNNESYYVAVRPDGRWEYNGFQYKHNKQNWQRTDKQGLYAYPVSLNFPSGLPNYIKRKAGLRTRGQDTAARMSVQVDGADLLLTANNGQQIGLVDGQLVNQIEGASLTMLDGYIDDDPIPAPLIYDLPMSYTYHLTVTADSPYTVTALADGVALRLSGFSQTSQISLTANLRHIGLTSTAAQPYCYYLADDNLPGASRAFDLCASSSPTGTTVISLTADSSQLGLMTSGPTTPYTLTVQQTGQEATEQTLSGQLPGGGTGESISQAKDGSGNWVSDRPPRSSTYLPIVVK